MANPKSDFDAAMQRLADEVRAGVTKTHPLTAAQSEAVEKAMVAKKAEAATVKERPQKTERPQTKGKRRRIVRRR